MDTMFGYIGARRHLLGAPEAALPNPAASRAQQLAAALAHREQRLAHRRAAAADGERTTRTASVHAAPVPPNTRSLRSRTRKDAQGRARPRAEPSQVSQLPEQVLSPPAAATPTTSTTTTSTSTTTGDVFGYVEDEELRVALDDALACITDPAARGPREVLADAAGALARMRLVHAAVLLRFAVRLNLGAERSRDEDAENFETFAHLRALFNCADAHVVAGILDRVTKAAVQEVAEEKTRTSATNTTVKTEQGTSVKMETEEEKEEEEEEGKKENKEEKKTKEEEQEEEWENLPIIPVEDADEFVPLLGSAGGAVRADAPSGLRVEAWAGGTRTVAAAAAAPGTVLHVLRGVVLRGERYGAALFTRGMGRRAGTYTVGCDFAQTARVRTRDDAVLAATRRACTCNASLYLAPVATADGDDDGVTAAAGGAVSTPPSRVLAIVADAPIHAGEEVTLPHEMLWETCLEPPPCSCPAALASAPSSGSATVSSQPEGTGCALAEFFEQRARLFETVRARGAASLLGARAPPEGEAGSRARPSRSRVRSSSSSRRRKQQQRRRALSPVGQGTGEGRPPLSREDRKLQAICERLKRLEERPPAPKRRHRDTDTSDRSSA